MNNLKNELVFYHPFRMSNINQTKCKHEWEVFTPAQYSPMNGKDYQAKFKCKKCHLKLHASDAMQLDMLRHEIRFKAWLSLFALIISLLSLAVSLFALFN